MTPADEDALIEQEERQASASALGEFGNPGSSHLGTTGSSSTTGTTGLPSNPVSGSVHQGSTVGQGSQHGSFVFSPTGVTSGCFGLPENYSPAEEIAM